MRPMPRAVPCSARRRRSAFQRTTDGSISDTAMPCVMSYLRGQRIRARVRRAEHRLFDGRAGVMRAQQHRGSRVRIVCPRDHAFEVAVDQAPRFAREHVGDRRSLCRDERFHGVRHRVEAGRDGDARGLRPRQRRVEDRDPERQLRIAARHLQVRRRIGNHRVGLRFAAGARRGRHADHREHRLRGLAVAAIVGDRAAVGQQQIDALGAVERAAAAERDEAVDVERGGRVAARFDHPCCRD